MAKEQQRRSGQRQTFQKGIIFITDESGSIAWVGGSTRCVPCSHADLYQLNFFTDLLTLASRLQLRKQMGANKSSLLEDSCALLKPIQLSLKIPRMVYRQKKGWVRTLFDVSFARVFSQFSTQSQEMPNKLEITTYESGEELRGRQDLEQLFLIYLKKKRRGRRPKMTVDCEEDLSERSSMFRTPLKQQSKDAIYFSSSSQKDEFAVPANMSPQ